MGDSYEEVLFQLGDIAYERLWNRPNAPRAMAKSLQAAEAYEQRQIELQELEAAMDEEEAAYQEFMQACEDELATCRATVAKHRRIVETLEGQARPVQASLVKKQKDLEVARGALQRFEARLHQAEEAGDAPKAAEMREPLKRLRIDVLRSTRQCEDLERELAVILHPEEGPEAVAMQARHRERELVEQVAERERGYAETSQDLNAQAALKDQQIKAAKDYFDQSLCALGQEVYAARISDPSLAVFYPKLDKFKR